MPNRAQPQQFKPSSSSTAATTSRNAKYLETIGIGKFKVEKLLIDGRVEYRLAKDTPAHLLTPQQRQFLTNEIRRLHSSNSNTSNNVSSVKGNAVKPAPAVHVPTVSVTQGPAVGMYPSILRGTRERIYESIKRDFEQLLKPAVETPFKSLEDAVDRLLPYHIVQYRESDYECQDSNLFTAQAEQNAVYFHQKFHQLQQRMSDITRRCANPKPTSSTSTSSSSSIDPYSILCEKLLNESDAFMNAELRKIGSAQQTMTFTPADMLMDSVQFDSSQMNGMTGVGSVNLFSSNNNGGVSPEDGDNSSVNEEDETDSDLDEDEEGEDEDEEMEQD